MFGPTFVPINGVAGTWSPAASNTVNISTIFFSPGGFLQVGNIVIFWGTVTLSAPAVGQSSCDFSAPIASKFSATTDAAGQAGATRTGIATQDLGTIFATVGPPASLHLLVNIDAAVTNLNFRFVGGYLLR